MKKSKTAIITARMTTADKQEIQKLAKRAKMTVTDYLTACALNKPIVKINGLDEILAELKAQGRNLNQLAVLANMGRIDFVDGKAILNAYASLYERFLAITSEVA